MYTLRHLDATSLVQTTTIHQAVQRVRHRRFCPSMFCFTDELVVHRVAKKANVWLLSDEHDDHSWLMIGKRPVCPHCGTTLL